jgi:hypothetical protein
MKRGRVIFLILAVCLGVAYWHWRATVTLATPNREASSVTTAPPPDNTQPAGIAPVASYPIGALRAELRARFHDTPLNSALTDALTAADVSSVANVLATSSERGDAARLSDLYQVCETFGAPEARAPPPLSASTGNMALLSKIHALSSVYIEHLQASCGSAHLDRSAIHQQLLLSAAQGDTASLDRLSASEPQHAGKLESAALLGNARAQLRLALRLLSSQPATARSWLESAIKTNSTANALYGSCLLTGCFGTPDPPEARHALESAATDGNSYALALLSGESPDAVNDWLQEELINANLVIANPVNGFGLSIQEQYAWATFAAHLASRGCFGFDLKTTGAALNAYSRLESALRAGDIVPAHAAADKLIHASGGHAAHLRGCD